MTQGDTTPTSGSLQIAQKFAAAIGRGDAEAVADMIDADFDVNARDAYGMTALHHAAANGARLCVRLLVKSGKCDYLAEDYKERTPAMLADEFSRDRAVAELLAKKQAQATFDQRQSQPASPEMP